MEIFLITFQSITILLTIGAIGFWAISRKIVPLKVLDVLSPLIIEISIPALIFVNILTKFNPNKLTNWYLLPFWWIGYTILIFILTMIVGKFIKSPEFKLGLLYPNSIFIPLAIIPALFASDSGMLVELFIFTLLSPVFVFNSYFYFYKGEGEINLKKIFNPILIATIISLTLVLTGGNAYVPELVIKVSKMLGALALPLVMILIGGNIFVDFKRRGEVNIKLVSLFLFFRNILFPAIVFGIICLIMPSKDVSFLIFLMTIVPPLTAIPVLVERAKGNTAVANQFIVSSLLLSSITIPLWLLLFSKVFNGL